MEPVALYRRIADEFIGRIRSGALPPGSRLPPTRKLSTELGTNRNTVVRAFAELEAEGWVESAVGRGTFVCRRATEPRSLPAAPPQAPHMPWDSLISRAAKTEPLSRVDRLARVAAPAGAINLASMQPSADLLPSGAVRKCADHVLRTLGPRALGYAPREGVPELRAQIARDLARRNIAVDPQDILVTTGSQQGLDLATRLLVDPGERFLVEQATYAGAINLLSAAGAQIVPVPTDEVGPDLDALDAIGKGGAKGFYLMPSCQNPTGATLPRERREALLRWSERSRVPLIEDDYGADLDLEGNGEPIALRALSGDVLHLGSYSKRLVPALRVGYLVAPRTLVPRLVGLKHAMDLGTSALLQHVLAEFLDRGYLVAHLEHSLPEYRRRRDAVAEVLQHHLPQGVRWSWPHRGLLFWLELPPEVAAEDIHEESRKRGVLVTPGTLNSAGATVRQGVRITFCAEPVERLEEGVRRLCAATAAVMSRRSHSLSSQPSYLSGA